MLTAFLIPMRNRANPPSRTRARSKLRKIVDHALADVCVLAKTTRDYSRAVAQRQVTALQRLFEMQGQQLDGWLEQISRHARSMTAAASMDGIRKLVCAARIDPIAGNGLAVRSMIGELLAVHEKLAEQLRADAQLCAEKLADLTTAALLTKLVDYHDSTAQLLRSLLSDEPELALIRVSP
jgi:DNA-binding ferritin-like protein